MKIAAIARSLNEEKYIKRFCENHQFCDLILIADGGSIDNTVHIARQFDNVLVRRYEKRIPLPDGSFYNPEPHHMNYLFSWAEDEGIDWIIVTDCDTWPNSHLQGEFRNIVKIASRAKREGIMANQVYLWGEDKWFPKISKAGPSQYAWRVDLGIRYPENGTTFFEIVVNGPNPDNCIVIKKPDVVLHYVSDQEREEKKVKKYKLWGYPKTHLLESIYAPPEDLPDWIKEYQV